MDTPEHLQLFNHLYPVPPVLAPGEPPTAAHKIAPFVRVHDRHRHEVEGQDHFAMPVDESVAFLAAHKGDLAAYDPVVCLLHKRQVIVNTMALCGETLDAFKERIRSHVVDNKTKRTLQQTVSRSLMPARNDEAGWEAFGLKYGQPRLVPSTKAEDILNFETNYGDGRLTTDDGQIIIPVDISWAGKMLGFHHARGGQPRSLDGAPHGGLHSVTAIQTLDKYFTEVVGIKPNHDVIRAHPSFCFNCNKTGQPQAVDPDLVEGNT